MCHSLTYLLKVLLTDILNKTNRDMFNNYRHFKLDALELVLVTINF